MTRLYNEAGEAVPVTLIEAGPCTVSRVKTQEKDGYVAALLTYGERKKMGRTAPRVLREIRFEETADVEVGQNVTVSTFVIGDKVKVTGTVKGRGYAGVVKRHGFHGSPKTHGHKHDLRAPGSIGSGWPQHVLKGIRMSGRMGGNLKTIHTLDIVAIDEKANLIGIRGSIPGAPGTLVIIQSVA